MGESNFNVFSLQVHHIVQAFGSHVVLQQVLQAMARKDSLTIIYKGESRIQVSIVSQQILYELIQELIANKEGIIRFEEDVGTIFFGGIFGYIAYQQPLLERCPAHLPITEAGYFESATQRIYRLDTYPIQTHTLLEGLGIILTTGIQLTDRLDELALRDTTSVVTNAYTQCILNGHLNLLSGTHLEFIDAIVHYFLQ